jgi:predicted metalloendopeptidase
MRSTRWSAFGPFLALLIMVGTLAPATAQKVPAAGHGLNAADMDPGVAPGEDFYRFANGGWIDRAQIPSYSGSYSVFTELRDGTRQQLLGLLRETGDGPSVPEGSDAWKAAAMFRQGSDMEARNALGLDPIRPQLAEIAAIDDVEALHAFLMTSQMRGIDGLFTLGVMPDVNDSAVNAVYLWPGYLGLPNRDYYLDEGADEDATREAYIATSADLLVLAGEEPEAARANAEAAFALERSLAAATMTREDQQDFALINNPRSLDELAALYPHVDWPAYTAGFGIEGVDTIFVGDLGYVDALPGIVDATPIETFRTFLALELLWSTAPLLDETTGETAFAFTGGVLDGVTEQRPLEERVLDDVNAELGEALGQLYVEAYFPPEAKAEISDMVDAMLVAFGQRIEANPWMSAETKVRAREKLDAMTVKVGYPDTWRSYASVEIGETYLDSLTSAMRANYAYQFAQAGKPVDPATWDDPPQTVNAYYNPLANEIVFPAGILQAPFFDYQADAATNFGGVGYVIGHEITHGFDLQGSQFDADGNLANWWAESDLARFTELNGALAAQYSTIEVLPGLHVNGQLTITENAADLGGLQIAYDALGVYLAEHGGTPVATPWSTPDASPEASPVAGFDLATATPQQRFFLSAATVWRQKIREEALATQVRTDPHSPSTVRGTMPLRNMDAFYEAFDIQPGDPMYLAPEERIVIW